jgi:hypothetical protein
MERFKRGCRKERKIDGLPTVKCSIRRHQKRIVGEEYMEYTKLGSTEALEWMCLESASVAWVSGTRNVGFTNGCLTRKGSGPRRAC